MCIRMSKMDGITAAEILTREHIAPVMLLTAMNDDELIERAADAGIVMYITKPWRSSEIRPAIEMALARHRDRMALEGRAADLEAKLTARKYVERATGILREKHGLTEQEAYRRIAKLSMNHRKTMREVAEAILLAESLSSEGTESAQ
jgi:response regulator NasT